MITKEKFISKCAWVLSMVRVRPEDIREGWEAEKYLNELVSNARKYRDKMDEIHLQATLLTYRSARDFFERNGFDIDYDLYDRLISGTVKGE